MPLNLEYIFIINIFMAILVTTLFERTDDHDGGCRRPRPPCGPTPGETLHSETIIRNKLMLLNLEKTLLFIYYYSSPLDIYSSLELYVLFPREREGQISREVGRTHVI